MIEAIVKKLHDPEEECPVRLSMEAITGSTLKIRNMVITIYKPIIMDEAGNQQPDQLENYIIEKICPAENVPPPPIDQLAVRQSLAVCFQLLESHYQYYLLLIKAGCAEKPARKKTRLKSDLLFKIARLNHLWMDKAG